MSNCSTCRKSQVLPTVFPCMACVEVINGKPIFKLWEGKKKVDIDVDYEMALTDATQELGGFNETQMPISEADFSA